MDGRTRAPCGINNESGDWDVWSNWFDVIRIPFRMVVLDFQYFLPVVESFLGFPSSCEIFVPQVTVAVAVNTRARGKYMQCWR